MNFSLLLLLLVAVYHFTLTLASPVDVTAVEAADQDPALSASVPSNDESALNANPESMPSLPVDERGPPFEATRSWWQRFLHKLKLFFSRAYREQYRKENEAYQVLSTKEKLEYKLQKGWQALSDLIVAFRFGIETATEVELKRLTREEWTQKLNNYVEIYGLENPSKEKEEEVRLMGRKAVCKIMRQSFRTLTDLHPKTTREVWKQFGLEEDLNKLVDAALRSIVGMNPIFPWTIQKGSLGEYKAFRGEFKAPVLP